jgi:hypothetical protein
MNFVFVGEMRVSDKGLVHGQDLAKAMGVEHVRTLPKKGEVKLIVGRLLGGRKPAVLVQAESRGLPVVSVADVIDADTGKRLVELLTSKSFLEPYEKLALEALSGAKPQKTLDTTLLADIFPMPPKRGKGRKSKKVAAA